MMLEDRALLQNNKSILKQHMMMLFVDQSVGRSYPVYSSIVSSTENSEIEDTRTNKRSTVVSVI